MYLILYIVRLVNIDSNNKGAVFVIRRLHYSKKKHFHNFNAKNIFLC